LWTETNRCGEQWQKVTPCWNPEAKDTIRAKKVAYKAWLQNEAESCLHSRYAEARKSAALAEKKSTMQFWENF